MLDIGDLSKSGAFINTTSAKSSLFALNHTSHKSCKPVLQLIKTIRRHTSNCISKNVFLTNLNKLFFILFQNAQGLIYDVIGNELYTVLKFAKIISKLSLKSMINFHKSDVIYWSIDFKVLPSGLF